MQLTDGEQTINNTDLGKLFYSAPRHGLVGGLNATVKMQNNLSKSQFANEQRCIDQQFHITLPILLPLVDALSVYLQLTVLPRAFICLCTSLSPNINPSSTNRFGRPYAQRASLAHFASPALRLRPPTYLRSGALSVHGGSGVTGRKWRNHQQTTVSPVTHCKTLSQQKHQQILWHAVVMSHVRGYKRACKTWQAGAKKCQPCRSP